MSTQPQPRLTPEEYLEIERRADFKSEYFGGEMLAMSGASFVHNLIAANLSVVCGKPQFVDGQFDTLVNPVVIIEVLSDSTRDYDRGSKFEMYRTLASLRDYILVAQDRVHVEHFVRQSESDWLPHESNDPGDSLALRSMELSIPLAEIYRGVEFS